MNGIKMSAKFEAEQATLPETVNISETEIAEEKNKAIKVEIINTISARLIVLHQ